MRIFLLFCLIFVNLSSQAEAQPDSETAMLTCAKIAENHNRLKCYDKLVNQFANNSLPAEKTKLIVDKHSRLVEATIDTDQDKVTLSKKDSFGKKTTQLNEIDSIKSTIVGEFKGWKKGAIILLANGHKWQVTSQNSGYVQYHNPEVIIEKGFWGSFNMRVKGLNAKAKVKRIN